MPAALPVTLSTPIQYAKGVGEARAGELVGLGIKTCGELLFYLPRDYLRFTDEGAVGEMKVGEVATVRGTILQTQMHRKPRARLVALMEDASGTQGGRCELTWFNPYDLVKRIVPGADVRVTGKVTMFRNRLQIVQGKVEVLDGKTGEALEKKSARIEPVYPATMGITSSAIWKILKGMVEGLVEEVEEWFGEEFLKERGLMTRREALRRIHMPVVLKDAIVAKRTLAYHEFFLHQAAVAIRRYHQRNSAPSIALRVDEAVDGRIRALLPFEMTGAQNRVIGEIRGDLSVGKPMNRLLQGDVGSGKTVVALYAMLAAVATKRSAEVKGLRTESGGEEGEVAVPPTQSSALSTQSFSGHQAALMAPTEILAEQHFMTLSRLLEGKKVKIALLTGSVTGAERRRVLEEIGTGKVGLVVGTHALLSEGVRFKSLAVVVIDEQHKFGVAQRSMMRTKAGSEGERGAVPHVLVMTATPIPRTLAMTAFGDLNVSVIDELPPGRMGIFTRMTPGSNREEVYGWLAGRLKAGEQAYVVVPMIDEMGGEEEGLEGMEDDAVGGDEEGAGGVQRVRVPLSLRNAVGVQRELQRGVLKEFRVGMMHGRMDQATRQHIMERFRQKLIDVLVSTTVIEVGVDVPNATMMVVEHADRFGLSQLHQLRGRVGRGKVQSYCILLGDLTGDNGIARLQAMVKHASGFKIAEEDLKLRGMGKMIGTVQSGRTDFHFAELLLDPVLLPLSRRDAFQVVAADPRLLDAGHGGLRKALLGKFGDSISLADVG